MQIQTFLLKVSGADGEKKIQTGLGPDAEDVAHILTPT